MPPEAKESDPLLRCAVPAKNFGPTNMPMNTCAVCARGGNEPHFLGYKSFIYLFENYGVLSQTTAALRTKMLVRGDQLLTSTFTLERYL